MRRLALTIALVLAAGCQTTVAFWVTLRSESYGLYVDYPPYGDFEIENLSQTALGFRLGDVNSANPQEFRSALEFDLSSIPAGAQILEARLILDFVSGSHLEGMVGFYGFVGDGVITRNDVLESAVFLSSAPRSNVDVDVGSWVSDIHASGHRYVGFAGRMMTRNATANYVTLAYWQIDPSRIRPSLLIRLSESHALPPIKLTWAVVRRPWDLLMQVDYSGVLQYSYDLSEWRNVNHNAPAPFSHMVNADNEPRIFWRVRGKSE